MIKLKDIIELLDSEQLHNLLAKTLSHEDVKPRIVLTGYANLIRLAERCKFTDDGYDAVT